MRLLKSNSILSLIPSPNKIFNNFNSSSVLEKYDILTGDSPLEVLISAIFILSIIGLLLNMLLLYQILFRYILKSNSENIIYICLKIFKKMDKEYIENKLNKLLRLNSFTSFMLFISITVLLI